MARQKKPPPEKATANWIFTYGDVMTLLLCFFVMLNMMSTMDLEKWKGFVMAIQGSPNIFDKPDYHQSNFGSSGLTHAPTIPEDMFNEPTDEWAEWIDDLLGLLDDLGMTDPGQGQTRIEIKYDDAQVIIRLPSDVVFETSRDTLRPEFYPTIDMVYNLIIMEGFGRNLLAEFEIQGHADIRPIQGYSPFTDNLGLSCARASAVWRYMQTEYNIPPDMMKSAGYGEYRPVDGIVGESTDPDREEIWARNRRVEFVLLRKFSVDEEGQGWAPGE